MTTQRKIKSVATPFLYTYKITGTRLGWTLPEIIFKTGTPMPSARGMTSEVLNAHLLLEDPRERVTFQPERKVNFFFAFLEFLQLVAGNGTLATVTRFVKKYGDYSTDGVFIDGAYGLRNAKTLTPDGDTQLNGIVKMLKRDADSRRAVMTFYDGSDLFGHGGLNTPCTLSYQFLVRDGKLHMIVNMRSNDVHYGLVNDVIVNTLVQELVADRLRLPLGSYFHNAGSLHVYHDIYEAMALRKPEKAGRIIREPMAPLNGVFEDDRAVFALLEYFENIDHPDDSTEAYLELQDDFSRDIANGASAFIHRNDENRDNPLTFYQWIKSSDIRRLTRPWLKETDRELSESKRRLRHRYSTKRKYTK